MPSLFFAKLFMDISDLNMRWAINGHRIMKHVIFLTLIVFVGFTLFMYLWQRHMIYLPAHEKPDLSEYQVEGMYEITLSTKDGLQLYAWYKPASEQQPTILYFHGNAGHIGYRIPLARRFIEAGLGVLLLEYRGYGRNEGYPSEQGLYRDAEAAMHFLKEQNVSADKVILFGESLGSGVAVHTAVEYPVCAVILQSPFTSMSDLARYHYPWAVLKPWDRFESLSKIDSIRAPLLILHGERDRIVPFAQARTLYQKAHQPKKIHAFEQGGHNNLWQMHTFVEEILRFARQYC